jgi:Carbohydrate-selective porin, OprB family/Sulfatase/C-terminal region of aryl-sulfatase
VCQTNAEKDTNWEGAFRVPAMVRWPGHIKPGSISNEIFSGHDWFPTLLAVAGDTDVKDRLLRGWQAGDRNYKVHIDGYNQLPHLTGQQENSDRKGFIYFNDDGQVVALRYGNWKIVFAEQKTPGTLDIWGEPFTFRRFPLIFNLRMDPYERAQITSNTYWDWTIHKGYLLMGAQAIVAAFIGTFREFPPSQRPQSFGIDQIMDLGIRRRRYRHPATGHPPVGAGDRPEWNANQQRSRPRIQPRGGGPHQRQADHHAVRARRSSVPRAFVEQQAALFAYPGSHQPCGATAAESVPPAGQSWPGPSGYLERFFPALLVPVPANREGSSWAVSYSFDQYFWQPDGNPKHGIGLFFGFGASDGNPNPIQYSFITGIGRKGVVPGRSDDTFGLGFARTQFSSAFVPFLRQQLNLGLQREDAVEIYYNAAVTQWLNVTSDLQIIGPGIKKALNGVGQLANVDTAVVAGARLRVRF